MDYQRFGKPQDGIQIIYCHGGPGAGSSLSVLKYFDLNKFNVILFDQRGSGKSTPAGELRNNTADHLVDDMEKLREHLNIKQWAIAGGSWGTTLALLYAEKFPQRVTGLILRGVLLAREADLLDYMIDSGIAATHHPQQWQAFKNRTMQLLNISDIQATGDMINDNYELLMSEKIIHHSSISDLAAYSLAQWELENIYREIPANVEEMARDPDGRNMGRIELMYMKHRCFLKDKNQILNNIEAIQHIPIFAIHGINDYVCPIRQAYDLYDAHPQVTLYETDAPHSGSDDQNAHFFALAMDEFATNHTNVKTISTTLESTGIVSALLLGAFCLFGCFRNKKSSPQDETMSLPRGKEKRK